MARHVNGERIVEISVYERQPEEESRWFDVHQSQKRWKRIYWKNFVCEKFYGYEMPRGHHQIVNVQYKHAIWCAVPQHSHVIYWSYLSSHCMTCVGYCVRRERFTRIRLRQAFAVRCACVRLVPLLILNCVHDVPTYPVPSAGMRPYTVVRKPLHFNR